MAARWSIRFGTSVKRPAMSLRRKIRSIALFEQLGLGLITGAADDDPSGIATYSQAGARFGYGLLWTMPLTYPLMTAIQLVSGEIGRVTGCGLARNMGRLLAQPIVTGLVGLLSIPVLAGSAAYAVGETRGWKCGLDNKPWEAVGFYAVIGAATLLGVSIDLMKLDPIKALFWSAVINGVIAVPMMVVMMLVVSRRDQMGRFIAGPALKTFGWATTAVMAFATMAMFVTMALGGAA